MSAAIWSLIGFLSGSIPFSLLMGHVVLGTDIRRYGDGNPGAANAWRAGRWRVGAPALVLDFLKGALPVWLAQFAAGLSGWRLAPVVLAPVLGHAFSPWLGFRGGKALAVTFGVWAGLTRGEVPLILGILLTLFYLSLRHDSWTVVLGGLAVLVYLLARRASPVWIVAWAGNAFLLAWKYRKGLKPGPDSPPILSRWFRRR